MVRHPISGGMDFWSGPHAYDGSLLDIVKLGAWLENKVGIKFNFNPGHSRIEGGRAVFFPKRATAGIHCMWVESASAGLRSTAT